MKRPPFSRGLDEEDREPSWYEQQKAAYKDDNYDRFRPRHEQMKILDRDDFTATVRTPFYSAPIYLPNAHGVPVSLLQGEDYTKKVVEPAIKKVCEDTGIRHAPNEEDCRRNLDNPDYYVRDWDVDEFNAVPFYDALNLYKKFCKKYLIDMRMFKRPRKERRQEVFAQVLETNQELSSFVEDNDRLIEQRHQEIKYRFEKVIPKLWDALTARAEFAALEEAKAKRFKSWEKTNFDENDEALRRMRDYLKIPPTVMQRQDVHGPSVLELVKSRKGMKKLLKEGHPYTEPDLKRLRRVHKGNRSVGKVLALLEGEVQQKEAEIKEFDLEQEPYNQLTEQEMRALYAWSKDGQSERTQKWRRSLQRRIRKANNEVLERRQSVISTSSLDSVPAPGELFAQMEEELRAREKEEREEEEARTRRRPGGVLQSLLDMAESDSDEEEHEARKAQLPVSRPTLKVSPLEEEKKSELEQRLLADGVLHGKEQEEEGKAEDGEEEGGNISGWLGAATGALHTDGREDGEMSTMVPSEFSDQLGNYSSEGEQEEDSLEQGEAEKKEEEEQDEEKEELQSGGSLEELGLLAPVIAGAEDVEESKAKEKDGEATELSLSQELAPLPPVANGEEDQEENKEDQEEDKKRRTSMFSRLGAFVSGYRRKSSRTSSVKTEEEVAPVLSQVRQSEEEGEVQLKRPAEGEGSVLAGREVAKGGSSGPVFVRPKASTRRAMLPTAAGEIKGSQEAPSNVLTSERIFELAAQGKIAESAHQLLDAWDGNLDWDAYLKDLGFVRRTELQDEELLKSHFGKHHRIVKLLADLCERKLAYGETLDMAEEAQLLTHNGKEMEKIYRFELALASPRGKHTSGKVVTPVVNEHKEEDRVLDKQTTAEEKQIEEEGELEVKDEEEEKDEEESEMQGGFEEFERAADSEGLKGLGKQRSEVIVAHNTQETEESETLEKHLNPNLEEGKEVERKSDELEAMPPPKPRKETSEIVRGGSLTGTTQLEPPGTSVTGTEGAKGTGQKLGKTGTNDLGDDISSDVSLVHAARSFELGLLGKLAREGSALLEATEWKEDVQWDEYFDKMRLWRVKDLKDRERVAVRFEKEASVINALVLICEKAIDNPEGLTHSQKAALFTHNGREMMSVFEFDKKFEEFLNERTG